MKFDILHNFISPATGRILCDPNYVLVGNSSGIAVPTIAIPITNLPNLSFNNFWVGTAADRPAESIVDIPVCYAATTVDVDGIYDNGIDGVGATIIIDGTEKLIIDNIIVPPNSLILVKDQASSYQNGVYLVTIGINQVILIRADFYDANYKIRQGDSISVQNGQINNNSRWIETNSIINVGIDDILYIGPMGPKGPQGPPGPQGPAGAAGNLINSIAGGAARGIANGFVSAFFDAVIGTGTAVIRGAVEGTVIGAFNAAFNDPIVGPSGAQGESGLSTILLVANLDLGGGRIENIAQSPGGDFDAVSARWVWDLLNDNVEIKWESVV